MTLREWVILKGLTQKQASKLFGATQQNLNKWMGPTTPKIEKLQEIVKITKGAVQPLDFLPAEKRAGDERLVKKGLCKPSVLTRWVAADGK